jgi:hypothetical protein
MSLLGGENTGKEGDPGVIGEVNSKTIQYFLTIWPILMSLGMGGSIIGSLYALIAYTQK